jgi:hypothetical protein
MTVNSFDLFNVADEYLQFVDECKVLSRPLIALTLYQNILEGSFAQMSEMSEAVEILKPLMAALEERIASSCFGPAPSIDKVDDPSRLGAVLVDYLKSEILDFLSREPFSEAADKDAWQEPLQFLADYASALS